MADPPTPRHGANRLRDATSPYLLQHAHNPVDWYPWGEEALAAARAQDKPIFLSIGYSACHWCHVMERESFEDEAVAAILNASFISVKVDREERPDLDEIYMTAVVGLTGHGGWPMSVFLTPDRRPFYGGTYFPPEDRYGMPGFKSVLRGVAQAWAQRRGEVMRSAAGLTEFVEAQLAGRTASGDAALAGVLDAAALRLRDTFDSAHGGWGGAPKFPSSGSIQLLLREHAACGDHDLLHMATFTLDRMARGGMYDQLGGGFHRYSVDGEWLVPHFEKMLYDNAQLATAYLEAYQATGNTAYRRVAEETFGYVLRDLCDPSGGFYSSEDADSGGEEGTFYLWTHDEVVSLLGEADGALFAAYYGVTPLGNFASHEPYHQGQNILHVPEPPESIAHAHGLTADALEARLAPMRAKLLEARGRRGRPGLDDKILTSWNAMMIAALAQGAQVLGEARYRDAARQAGEFVRDTLVREGQVYRTHRRGETRLPGYLDDYAWAASAFVDLYETDFDAAWLTLARGVADEMVRRFWDEGPGLFTFTGAEHTYTLVRTRPTYDGAEPSGNSVAALVLQRLALFTGEAAYATKARRILEAAAPGVRQAPQGYLKLLLALDFLERGAREIAVAGPAQGAETAALLRALRGAFVPNKIVACVDPGAPEALALSEAIPLLAHKGLVNGHAAAYVCRNYTCDAPVTAPEALVERLRK